MATTTPQKQDILTLARDFIPLTRTLTQEQKEFALVLMKNMTKSHNGKGTIQEDEPCHQKEKRDLFG